MGWLKYLICMVCVSDKLLLGCLTERMGENSNSDQSVFCTGLCHLLVYSLGSLGT